MPILMPPVVGIFESRLTDRWHREHTWGAIGAEDAESIDEREEEEAAEAIEPCELAELVRRISWTGCDPGLLGAGCAARVCSWRRLEADMRIGGDGGDKQ